MDKIWITFVLLIIALIYVKTNGQSVLNVQLSVKKYVERGSEVGLYCENNAAPDILYKVTFLKGDSKIFEYIKGRNPPYRNYSIAGAEIDWKKVTPSRLMLKNVDYEASGSYYCEVSTDTPIFTKASNDEQMHVMLPQKGPPSIEFAKNQLYYGDMLVANCTTSRARPAPHITWLINGKQVDDSHVRQLHHSSKNSHRSQQSKTAQLALSPPQTAPSYVSQTQSIYHGRVIPSAAAAANGGAGGAGGYGGNGGGSGGNSLKELKAKARAVDDELKAAKASLAAAGGQYSGGFQIQPNIGYNSFDGGYGFGFAGKMHHRERSGGVGAGGSNIGVFTIGGDRMGDEADEDEESEKKTSWQHGFGGASNGKGDYHNTYYDNNGKQQQQQQQQQQHFDNFYRKHRNSYEHKYRRHVNDASSSGGNSGGPVEPRKIHRVSASYSQLSIRITEALTNNLGRIEITCLATIPAHVEPGAEYADYKTSLIKLDIEQNDLTSPEPSTGSLAHAKSDAVQTSNFQAPSGSVCRNLLAVQCGIVMLLLLYHRRSAAAWFLVSSLS